MRSWHVQVEQKRCGSLVGSRLDEDGIWALLGGNHVGQVFYIDNGLVKPMYLLLVASEKYTQGVSDTSWRGGRA